MTVSDALLVKAYNDVEKFPTIKEVADALGIAKKTVKNRITDLRKRAALDDSLPSVISRANLGRLPMSEDASRFMEDWGPDECVAELRRVAEIDPDHIVSRNYFRVHSLISESTWNRYFGTFEEFKRQAGIKLSRAQHAVERQIAKHVSADNYREIGAERSDWGERYIRESRRKFKTALVASDLHDKEIDLFFLRVFVDTAKRVQPDVIILGGDVFDLAEFGRFNVDPREWDVIGRIRFVHDEILSPLREACPDAQIDMIEGNHEARLLRLLADATPALRAVLSDLHGFTVGKLLGLEEFEVNYIAQADLASWTKRDQERELANNYKIYWDSFLVHHFPHARNMGMPGVNGHHHKHQVWPMFSPMFGAYEWHQLGSGHRRRASYTEGEKWHNGFAIVNVNKETKSTAFDYIQITDFAISGGKWYHRQKSEDYRVTYST